MSDQTPQTPRTLRRRIIEDVEVFMRVYKHATSTPVTASILKSVCSKLSNEKDINSSDSNEGNGWFLSKDAIGVFTKVIATKDNKIAAHTALKCLIAAVKNGYVEETSIIDLINLLDVSLIYDRPDVSASDVISLLSILLQNEKEKTMSRIETWIPLLLRYCVDHTVKDRAHAITLLESIAADETIKTLDFGSLLSDDLKKIIVPEMLRLVNDLCQPQMLYLWSHLVILLDQALRRGSSLLNCILPIVETCMKIQDDDIRAKAFTSWRNLIDNFGKEACIINHHSHFKLLLQPLLCAGLSSTNEKLALEKLKTWWALMQNLKSDLEDQFWEVVVPFLRFCIGGDYEVYSTKKQLNNSGFSTPERNKDILTVLRSPSTPKSPRLYFCESGGADVNVPGPKSFMCHTSIQKMVGEIIMNILCGDKEKLVSPKLAPLLTPCCTRPETFEAHSALLIQCLRIWKGTCEEVTEDTKTIISTCWSAIFNGLESAKTTLPVDRFDLLSNVVAVQLEEFVGENDQCVELKQSMVALLATASKSEIEILRTTPTRGILKNVRIAAQVHENIETDDCGHEIILPRHFSPKSTPSAGILKKRRNIFDEPNGGEEINLSPSEQRRVHFSTDMALLPASDDEGEQIRHSPRKRFRPNSQSYSNGVASTPPGASFSNRFLMRTIQMVQQANNNAIGEVSCNQSSAETTSTTETSNQTNKESQLDCRQPIYPSLVNCTETVDAIIPQLSPTSWYRTLAIFLKGRDITTIGQLAALTEFQIYPFPIRQPKIENLRKTFQQFERDRLRGGDRQTKSPNRLNGATSIVSPILNGHQKSTPVSEQERTPTEKIPVKDVAEPVVIVIDSDSPTMAVPPNLNKDISCQTDALERTNQDFECQTDYASREMSCQINPTLPAIASNFLSSLSEQAVVDLPTEELRGISQDLMASLSIIFDNLKRRE